MAFGACLQPMPSPLPPPLERATPLFGSLVRIRVEGCGHDRAVAATSMAFAAMTRIHRLMSFHEPDSELSALNRTASRRTMRVTRDMAAALTEALAIAGASAGAFDPTVGGMAVRAGALPRPEGAPDPDPAADWRDVDFDAEARTVRFRRPLWLDLGGVAKGYAVDLASRTLMRGGAPQGCVNAGGDLRIFGPGSERVGLDVGTAAPRAGRAVLLTNRSLASSGGVGADRSDALALHFDRARRRRSPRRFATVMAERCVHADALTKVVLARGRAAHGLLLAYGASAAICSPELQWSICGAPN